MTPAFQPRPPRVVFAHPSNTAGSAREFKRLELNIEAGILTVVHPSGQVERFPLAEISGLAIHVDGLTA